MKRDMLKKTAALVLCLVMLLSLTACKSSAVKNVETLIAGLGEITADSEAAVEAAEAAYAALSDSDKAQVETAQALTEARVALDAALKEAKRQAILGKWSLEVDATQAMVDELADQLQMDASALRDAVGSFSFQGDLELKEDGTYMMSMDAESFKNSLNTLLQNIKPVMRDVMAKMLSKEILGREDGTVEEIEELLKSILGMSLDDLIDIGLASINSEDYMSSVADANQEGRYLIDLDKNVLYFSDSPDKDPDTANGENFTLSDGVMVIADCFGEGFFDQFYPVTLTKTS